MRRFAHNLEAEGKSAPGHLGYHVLTEENGLRPGVLGGFSVYTCKEYQDPGIHENFDEVFFVLSGNGMAKVGDEEFQLTPYTWFFANANEPHQIKCHRECDELAVLVFHSPTCD